MDRAKEESYIPGVEDSNKQSSKLQKTDNKNQIDTFLARESSIKPLKQKFVGKGEVRGFKFTQISKTNKAFLYKVNTGDTKYYEVFKKRLNTRYKCESYPTSKAFGIWAWTYMNLESANKKFNQLISCD